MVSFNTRPIDIEEIKRVTQRDDLVGLLLTVADTILQNYDILNFYKHAMGCVGLEMEGYYYAAEVESKIKHKMISPGFVVGLGGKDNKLDNKDNKSR